MDRGGKALIHKMWIICLFYLFPKQLVEVGGLVEEGQLTQKGVPKEIGIMVNSILRILSKKTVLLIWKLIK